MAKRQPKPERAVAVDIRSARLVRRVATVERSACYNARGRWVGTVGRLYHLGRCGWCGAEVLERVTVGQDEPPAACEVCRRSATEVKL